MRIANRYSDPNCAKSLVTWAPTAAGMGVTVSQDGPHLKYALSYPGMAVLVKAPEGVECVAWNLLPASSVKSISMESPVVLIDGGLVVANISGVSNRRSAFHCTESVDVTVAGLCCCTLAEWSCIQTVGATIFAADTAPY